MPNTIKRRYTNHRDLTFDDELIAEINEWRRQQPHLPNFTAAVRSLIKLGLEKGKPNASQV
jgi:hypothetical protein